VTHNDRKMGCSAMVVENHGVQNTFLDKLWFPELL
jgi:hypothetical protein